MRYCRWKCQQYLYSNFKLAAFILRLLNEFRKNISMYVPDQLNFIKERKWKGKQHLHWTIHFFFLHCVQLQLENWILSLPTCETGEMQVNVLMRKFSAGKNKILFNGQTLSRENGSRCTEVKRWFSAHSAVLLQYLAFSAVLKFSFIALHRDFCFYPCGYSISIVICYFFKVHFW